MRYCTSISTPDGSSVVCPLLTCLFLNAEKWTVLFLKNISRSSFDIAVCAWYAGWAWCFECAWYAQGRVIGLLSRTCPSICPSIIIVWESIISMVRIREGWNWIKQCECENASEGMVMASKSTGDSYRIEKERQRLWEGSIRGFEGVGKGWEGLGEGLEGLSGVCSPKGT